MTPSSRKRLTPNDRLRIATAACCDERSVKKWIRGDELRPGTKERIERAVRELFGAAA